MPKVLTESSNVTCGHPPGRVSTTGTPKLTVQAHPVLLKRGVEGRVVHGCLTQDDPNSGMERCKKVEAVNVGEATKLTVNGKPVMLDTLAGATDGKVGGISQQLVKAYQVQSKLTAL